MNAHTNKGFASRIGFGLGTLVRFCLHDRRPAVRWVKRTCLVVVLFVIFAQNFTWLTSTFMSILLICAVFFLIAQAGASDGPDLVRKINEGADSEFGGIPNRGEYDHPDYYNYYSD
ncbi:hypothetical protein [Pseudomonas sp. BDPW]|uniref:hypothetical protein n=1 Tax=Pseudomonas sp. BDPW TaxID=2806612 RepID=UPI001EED247A|nr:hypothetical protein [Pseudomonas sp. BDPW]